MARLPYDIWATRKRTTAKQIVELGVLDLTQLDEFLNERGVALPVDLAEFEKIWSASSKPESDKVVKKPTPKKVVKTTTKSTRTTRRKSNIKDTNK